MNPRFHVLRNQTSWRKLSVTKIKQGHILARHQRLLNPLGVRMRWPELHRKSAVPLSDKLKCAILQDCRNLVVVGKDHQHSTILSERGGDSRRGPRETEI